MERITTLIVAVAQTASVTSTAYAAPSEKEEQFAVCQFVFPTRQANGIRRKK